jgi:hypothetical protein
MAGDTPKEDNTTEPTPNGQEPQGVAFSLPQRAEALLVD